MLFRMANERNDKYSCNEFTEFENVRPHRWLFLFIEDKLQNNPDG